MKSNGNNGRNAHKRPTVVVIGAGFGGLNAVRALSKAPVNIILIDRDNYHTFSPLLYQVAAAEIGPNDIGYPVRKILQKYKNARFILGDVRNIDFAVQNVQTENLTIPYDYLIIGIGSTTHHFGIPGAAEHSLPLKNLEQAVTLRNHILDCFERASHEQDAVIRKRLLTFVIVGGGPTGVEYVGALSELIYGPLKRDYRTLDFREISLILIEAADSLLSSMTPRLRAYTLNRLRKMKVEILLNTKVARLEKSAVLLSDGQRLGSETIIWTAGVMGEPVAKHWGLQALLNSQISVLPTMQVPDYPNVYVIGDLAFVKQGGSKLPMIAPVAMQEGETAGRNIIRQLSGKEPLPFRYKDMGTLATIGRNAAVAQFGPLKLTGYPAWITWLTIHLIKLIGFRNRLLVMINWSWDYLFFERTLRIIMPRENTQSSEMAPQNKSSKTIESFESKAVKNI